MTSPQLEFGTPYLFFWCVPVLFFWALEYWNIFRRPVLFVPSKYLGRRLFIERSLIFLVGVFAWLLIGFSLTGPRKPVGHVQGDIEANDIFFVVDVSLSMLAEDFKPNRLEVSKEKIKNFVELRPQDRIGIITFAEKAFTLLPLTRDLGLVRKMIKEINVGFLGSGTNIGDALGLAVIKGIHSLAQNKVIILLTDGVSNVGTITPEEAAVMAQEKNIKIYAIGIGGEKSAKIPIGKTVLGQKRYQLLPGGSIDMKVLKKIATITGGKEFLAEDQNALGNILTKIEELEKGKIQVLGKTLYNEMYLKYLIWGLLLLISVELTRKIWIREV